LKKRDLLLTILLAAPGAGTEGPHVGQLMLVDEAAPVGRSTKVLVVDHDKTPVARLMYVELDTVNPEITRPKKCCHSVLGHIR